MSSKPPTDTAAIPGLSAAGAERLALLMEECGEVVQIIGKVLRHGYESHHPNGGPTNRELLEHELGDVRAAMRLMFWSSDVSDEAVAIRTTEKLGRVGKYLHHQPQGLMIVSSKPQTETAEPTLQQFAASLRAAVDRFEANWIAERKAAPAMWPDRMGEADWHEQFVMFLSEDT